MQKNTTHILREKDKGYEFIRFFAMMMIIFYHLLTTFKEYHINTPKILQKICLEYPLTMGAVAVALFFMLSGAVLIKNYKENLSARTFYKKRLTKIETPQILAYILCFPLIYCLYPQMIDSDILGILISMTGLAYHQQVWQSFHISTPNFIGEWFTAAIIICYLLFPLLRFLFIRYRMLGTILITTIFATNLKLEIFTYEDGYFSITNGIMYFWLGMLFETYKKHIKKPLIFIFALFIIAFAYINPPMLLSITYLPCFIFSIFCFAILYQITLENNFTRYICKYSFEIYLIHHSFYRFTLPALLNIYSNSIQLISASIFAIFIILLFAKKLQEISEMTLTTIKNIYTQIKK